MTNRSRSRSWKRDRERELLIFIRNGELHRKWIAYHTKKKGNSMRKIKRIVAKKFFNFAYERGYRDGHNQGRVDTFDYAIKRIDLLEKGLK